MRRLFCLQLALLGCAAEKPLPPWYTAVDVDHPRFGRARFITGVGLSSLSADDADARAKAAVGNSISSNVESELSSFQQLTSAAGTAETFTQRVSITSEFGRADLIQVIERARQGRMFYSFAALDRDATARELAAQANADLATFRTAAGTAKQALAEREMGVFGSAAGEAQRLQARLDASFVVRRAIVGHASAAEADYVPVRNELLSGIEGARARRVVGVLFSKGAAGHLGDLAINAVKNLGIRPDAKACKDRDAAGRPDATELAIEPEESCREGPLGERCEIVVHLIAQACSGHASGAGTVPQVRGVHPNDPEKARRSAWDKVTAQAVEAAVRDALKSAIAIGAE
jgi:hypothetical protein